MRAARALAAASAALAVQAALAVPPEQNLAAAIRLETISHENPAEFNPKPFLALHRLLADAYPQTHARLTREVVAEYSLLYTWRGSDPELAPMLLTAHLDVVPVTPEALPDWDHPPFAGEIADGFVWGRGAIDDKGSLIALFEAVEQLVASGFTPRRTIVLAFGHDEEVGGARGAGALTELLRKRGVRLWMSLDEGLAVISETGGITGSAALIGVAEKGFLTLDITAREPGGHSSTPPKQSAIGRLARAIQRLEENPLPARIDGVAAQMFDALAPQLPFERRLAIQNRSWLAPVIEWALSGDPATNALIRTTTAVTMVRGGVKENVLPQSATATANFRLLPGDSVDEVVAHVREVLGDDAIEITKRTAVDASDVAPTDGPQFDAVKAALAEVDPGLPVAPALVLGGTDTRWYGQISDAAYRFVPFHLDATDLRRAHGTDERLSLENLGWGVRFYGALIRHAAGEGAK
ncbi:MAG TPA: M20 family peptidase [Myxococcota bacterium]|nr:M20 family peptidase [Myxococcota bacterium]